MFILGAASILTSIINNCLSIGLLSELPALIRRGSIGSTILFVLQCLLYSASVALPVIMITLGLKQVVDAKKLAQFGSKGAAMSRLFEEEMMPWLES